MISSITKHANQTNRTITFPAFFLGVSATLLFFCPLRSWGLDAPPDTPVDSSLSMSPQKSRGAKEATSEHAVSIDDEYIEGKLQIGTRSVYRILTRADSGHKGGGYRSGTFLGSIYALDEEQNYMPLKPFLTYYFTEYIGIDAAYDYVEANTVALTGGTYVEPKSDGTASLGGPTLTFLGRYPNSSSFIPFAGIGVGFFRGGFDEDPAWALGYPDPTVYDNLGRPTTIYNGRVRQMEVSDTTAFLLTAGVTWKFSTSWSTDLSAEYMQADADATFRGYTYGKLNTILVGSFPMDNVAIRVGLVYEL